MRPILLIFLAFLIGEVYSQKIAYGSALCLKFTMSSKSSTAAKSKFKALVDNLAKDKTLKAQNDRVKKWLNNNFKEIGLTKKAVPGILADVQDALGSRWRIVAYYNGLLAKIKPKIGAAKFTEIKKKLWEWDAKSKSVAGKGYSNWKGDVDEAIPQAKLATVQKIIADYELDDEKKQPKDFYNDVSDWQLLMGSYIGCDY